MTSSDAHERRDAAHSMLSISRLHATYLADEGEVHAVNNVNFELQPGEFFTLLGPSGCGKTTILRCIAGFERPSSGSITIDGVVVSSDVPERFVPVHRRDISMVFQSYAIWPHMSVAENVAFPLNAQRFPRRDVRARVERALELVNLGDHYHRPATQLSGGQQQRVALARAIVKDARLLLLDEPLSNLDAQLRVQMRSELSALQSRLGTTTLYVTHDQDEALSLSDRIAVMCAGQAIEIGTPTTLYLKPRRLFTARFIGQTELLAATVVARSNEMVTVETDIGSINVSHDGAALSAEPTLMIRPEHMELVDPETTQENVIFGSIKKVDFTGRVVEYTVCVAARQLRVQSLSAVIRRCGENVGVYLPPERCVLIDESE